MCLISEMSEPMVTEQDTIVYKVFRAEGKKLYAPLMGIEYDVNEPPRQVELVASRNVYIDKYVVEEGYHTCSGLVHAEILVMELNNNRATMLRGNSTYVIMECVIPKDTKYYRGYWSVNGLVEQWASERIILKRLVTQGYSL